MEGTAHEQRVLFMKEDLFLAMHRTLNRLISLLAVSMETRRKVRSLGLATLHKTARVYGKTNRGQPLFELHNAAFPGIRDWATHACYFLRVIGCLFDEGIVVPGQLHYHTHDAWRHYDRWSSIVAAIWSSNSFYHDVWHVGFKAVTQWEETPLLPIWRRALDLTATFADAGVPYELTRPCLSMRSILHGRTVWKQCQGRYADG